MSQTRGVAVVTCVVSGGSMGANRGKNWLDKAEDEERRVSVIELIMALRSRGVRDTRVLAAVEKIPRHLFVNPAFSAQAYSDHALPIECGQTISQPFVVAYMTELLEVDDRCKVLEIGTGSGYQTAVLSILARRVYTIERYRTLLREAEARFAELGITNITTMVGDGTEGWKAQAPFDRIIVTAACEEVPETLLNQLKTGGYLVAPIGPADGTQHIVQFHKSTKGLEQRKLVPVRFVPLVAGRAPH